MRSIKTLFSLILLSLWNRKWLFAYINVLLLLVLSCGNFPANPRNVSNANVKLILTSSNGLINENLLNDSIGKNITIQVILELPEFIKNTKLVIQSANDSVEFETSLPSSSKNLFDTIPVPRILTSVGEKKVIATCLKEDGKSKADTADLIIFDRLITNHQPHLSITGNLTTTPEKACSLTVTANDSDLDQTHTIVAIDKGKSAPITGNQFIWKAPDGFIGKDTITFIATDNGNPALSDTIYAHITCDAAIDDTIKPVITLQSPTIDSVSISSITLTVECTDQSGVKLVTGTLGTNVIPFSPGSNNIYTATVSGLVEGVNDIIITATDSAPKPNVTTKTFSIVYDPKRVVPKQYKITPSVSGSGGTINPSNEAQISDGKDITFTFTPNIGFTIDSVFIDGVADAGAKASKQFTFTAIKSDHTIRVRFALKKYTLTINPINADVGAVSGSITQNPSGTLLDSNTTVQLTAPIDPKYTFINWTGDVTGTSQSISIVMNGNKTITANYKIKKNTITFNYQDGRPLGTQTIIYGNKASKPIDTTRANYTFGGWFQEQGAINEWNFSNVVTNSDTLFAKWIPINETTDTTVIQPGPGDAVDCMIAGAAGNETPSWPNTNFGKSEIYCALEIMIPILLQED